MREGRIGNVKLIYAEVNHGRIEAWHPAPIVFYQGGPMYDVGVYPLALATAFFGPAKRVSSYGKILLPKRVTKDGKPWTLSTPDYFCANIELASGPVIRLTANFYVQGRNTRQGECMEFHGDKGSLLLANWFGFNSEVEVSELNKEFVKVPPVRPPTYKDSVEWGRILKELMDAIKAKRPHRASVEHAAHVVEVINAVAASAKQGGKAVTITSTFKQPDPMPWAV
jgi:predicted dehydrogenase